ncbi:MAG TPA: LCP family protein [Acidimicrobiales bacterium]|nr:LCP family protein [Acidimicrobiales bacterium]
MITGPRRLLVAVALVLVPVAGPGLSRQTVTLATDTAAGWADGRPLLVIVEDAVAPGEPFAWVRAEERRADAVIVVRWLRSCDRLQVVSIPRDLVLDPGGEPLAVVFGTAGRAGVENAVRSAFGLDLFATATLDLDDVGALAGALGPVELHLAAPSRDRRTGFTGGPGPVVLDADDVVAFLRSRTWEERRDGQWVVVTDDDAGRIRRQQAYLAMAVAAARRLSPAGTLRLGAALGGHGDIVVHDHAPIMGFLAGLRGAGDVELASVAVEDERPDRERRSPFLPGEVSAMRRSVLAPGGGDVLAGPGCAAPAPAREAAAG